MITATYSPDDNKIRLYASTRLNAETYARVKAAGFAWAPRQQLFVAPAWTPAREDLAIELAGEIGDEDTSLVDRAEERAERFEDYSDKRAADAERARDAVAAIADNIPLGQPILVGHHSEKRARKDAERIRNGMDKAVQMWRTAKYWTARAEGAIRHAKYKELPDVRHRRIKTIEAEARKVERSKAESERWLRLWTKCGEIADPDLQHRAAVTLANTCWLHLPRKEGDRPDFNQCPTAHSALTNAHPSLYAPRTVAEVVEHAKQVYPRSIANAERWLQHYANRLAYERAMLAEQIGTEASTNPLADRFPFAVGGQVLTRKGAWVTILKVNRGANGSVSSLTTTAAPGSRTKRAQWRVESIRDYREPSAETEAAAKTAAKIPPLCNYPGEGFAHMTAADYDKVPKAYRGYRERDATDTAGRHRTRVAIGAYAFRGESDMNRRHSYVPVYVTDAKRIDPPAPPPPTEPTEPEAFVREFVAPPVPRAPVEIDDRDTVFEAMQQALREGVKVVAAPQLFPTPPDLARKAVALADIWPGQRVLEPNAGTGALLDPVFSAFTGADCGRVVAVEINPQLAEALRERRNKRLYANEANFEIRCADFLECSPDDLGTFHRVVMNPPFENGADIKHIEHARRFLKPGGKLAAICANGPRQRERLMPIAAHWEDLPAGTFKDAGTSVNTALLIIEA
jgi:SAM-dependent methyltransferase